jgi:hypothetical protein
MATLIFLLTLLSLVVLLIINIIKAIQRKPVKSTRKKLAVLVGAYFVGWAIFYSLAKPIVVPLATDVCFDDWCATITRIEKGDTVQRQFSSLSTDSAWLILHIRMSNHARGIAQKPSEPRVHIVDDKGNQWTYSVNGQQLFEKQSGKQVGIDQRLELGQSLETKLVFAVPAHSTGLKILIEEGPFITKLLFADDYSVFTVPSN